MKLGKQYAGVRSNLLMMHPLPSLSQAYRFVVQEQRHKELSDLADNATEPMAFVADKRRFDTRGNNQHNKSNVQNAGIGYNANKSYSGYKRPFCDHCKVNGHTIDKCFKIHGYPNQRISNTSFKKFAHYANNDNTDHTDISAGSEAGNTGNISLTLEVCQQLINMLNAQKETQEQNNVSENAALVAGKFCMLSHNSNSWIIDSGATDHMCHNLTLFTSYELVKESDSFITIPDGGKVQVTHVGEVKLSEHIILKKVLFVPSFQFNLISVPKLCLDNSCSIQFTPSTCIVQGSSMIKPTVLGRFHSGLYHLSNNFCIPSAVSKPASTSHKGQTHNATCSSISCLSAIEEAKLLHLRIGHIPFKNLSKIDSSINNKCAKHDFFCTICPVAKQNRKSFPISSIKTIKPFQMLHVDLWGPYKVTTHNGCNCFLTIVDDFTRATWVYLLKFKKDSVTSLKNFVAYIQTQYNTSVQIIRTDDALELCKGDILQFYLDKGIEHQQSCVETPQQNGVVERKHKHLLETARTLYFQSKVPPKYWGDCVQCAAHLINRMPLSVLNFLSPYEKLFGSKPDYSTLRVFGCLCYTSTIKQNRTKFDSKANPSVFLGYPHAQKGYKVLNLTTNKIQVSRDVTFYEKHFPFHYDKTSNNVPFFLPTSTPLPYLDDFHSVPDVFQPINSSNSSQSSVTSTENSSPGHTDQAPDPAPLLNSNLVDLSSNISSSSNVSPVRKSTRTSHPPAYLKDYVCPLTKNNTPTSLNTHWCNLVSFSALTPKVQQSINNTAQMIEPKSYKEASTDIKWIEAMEKKIQALEQNNTWDLVALPKGKKAVGCKWVYRIKLKADGTIERYKARLVAKGYTQQYGIDYEETFSPVVKMATVRSVIALAASRKWKIHQLDVNNAFLHGDLNEEIYMQVPEGVPNPNNMVCKLKKSLYGLKQASRQWFAKLLQELKFQGFEQSKNDYSLFIKKRGTDITIAAVYVDDVIVTGSNTEAIQNLKDHLHKTFSIKDLGYLNYLLGLEVGYVPKGITLTQCKFTKELLKESGITEFKPAVTPLPVNLKLQAEEGDLCSDPATYRKLVGKLNFLSNTRPDLPYTVQTLS
ncbi:Retrovirus-related Pol polyprotein from transposon TNT 1-94 [Bienertia sinuspersici]